MSREKPSIMVIEDEKLLLEAITKKITLNNLSVIPCMSGDEAIAYLHDHTDLPDVIWLDYYLKDMNGLEFMNKIKENSLWSNIPVVVVSNSASHEKVASMLALGVKDYILKAEYRLDEIIPILLKFVHQEP